MGFSVTSAWSPLESADHWYAITRNWRQQIPEINTARELCCQIGETLFKHKAGMGTPKYLLFNEDVDVADTRDVVRSFTTRNHPGSQGEIIFKD